MVNDAKGQYTYPGTHIEKNTLSTYMYRKKRPRI